MKLLIDIPEKDYTAVRDSHALMGKALFDLSNVMARSIKNGVPYSEVSDKHAKWIEYDFRTILGLSESIYKCSNCNHGGQTFKHNFCPHCGYIMDV